MKYFTADPQGNINLGSAPAARRWLKSNPQAQTVTRWWWSGQDLIECEEYSREQILNTKTSTLEKGATAQWAVTHHAIE